jgi:hypothetical protein
MRPLIYFGLEDIGCFADGAFGHQHCRNTLANLVDYIDQRRLVSREFETLSRSLRGEMPEDAWDEYEALDLLNEHCDPRVAFAFEWGDLILGEVES